MFEETLRNVGVVPERRRPQTTMAVYSGTFDRSCLRIAGRAPDFPVELTTLVNSPMTLGVATAYQ
jgi:hypothetical protein